MGFAQEHQLRLIARQPLDEMKIVLSEPERRWLEQKGGLVVGIMDKSLPPLSIFVPGQRFEGILADYLAALQRTLGLPISVRSFSSREALFAALRDGKIDMVGNITSLLATNSGLVLSPVYALSDLSLLSEGRDLYEYSTDDGRTRIAFADDEMLALFRSVGGQGHFQRYPSALEGMVSVLTGENDVFLGDELSSLYLSSQLFAKQLVINQSEKLPEVQIGFGLMPQHTVLRGILQRALGSLSRCQKITAQHTWVPAGDCRTGDFRSRLSEEEREWLDHVGTVRLAISEDLAPYAFFNGWGRFSGVASDVLDIVRRKTGLRFEIERVSSLSEADALLGRGLATLSFLPETSSTGLSHLHTIELASAPYLYVQRQDVPRMTLDAQTRATVVVVKGYIDPRQFSTKYPYLVFRQAETMGEAFNRVRDGEADLALAPANILRFYQYYKYQNSLKVGGVFQGPHVRFVLSARPEQQQLISILDKALLEIAPRDSLQILGRWRSNSATDEKYWEGVASYIRRSFELLGVLLAVAGVLLIAQRRRIKRKRQDLVQRQMLLDELQAAKESADRASRAKTVFLATMSHEIRTPLNAIIGMLELLITRRGEPELNQHSMHIAYESAVSLLALIGDILDISRIESSKMTLSLEPVRMSEVLESVGNVFSGLARQKQLRMTLDIDTEASEQVWMDAVKVKQIVSNLLSNAIKFTQHGNVELRCSVTDVDDEALSFRISVTDTGAGIPATQVDQVFKPFYLVDGAVGDRNAGAGLGLAISYSLCQLMGGTLEVESEEGIGTQMIFALNLNRVKVDSVVLPHSSESAQEIDEPLTVLVVEDHLPSQYLLVQQIGYLGHRTLTASNGLEGIAAWSQYDIDVIITDCNMPEMDGLEMAKAIRRLEHSQGNRPCLIIGLTADAQREALQQCRDAGMDHALAKPTNLAMLNRLVPKFSTQASREPEGLPWSHNIRASMAQQVVASNKEESVSLRIALHNDDLSALQRTAHKLKGTAYLLNHQVLLEQCVEVEDLCESGFTQAVREAGQSLLATLEQITQSLQAE